MAVPELEAPRRDRDAVMVFVGETEEKERDLVAVMVSVGEIETETPGREVAVVETETATGRRERDAVVVGVTRRRERDAVVVGVTRRRERDAVVVVVTATGRRERDAVVVGVTRRRERDAVVVVVTPAGRVGETEVEPRTIADETGDVVAAPICALTAKRPARPTTSLYRLGMSLYLLYIRKISLGFLHYDPQRRVIM